MRAFTVLPGVLVLLMAGASVDTQSLADIARREDARRKAIKTPAKTYTNEDLRRDPRDRTVVAPSPPATSAGGPAAPGVSRPDDEPEEPGGPAPSAGIRDQAYWQDRIVPARQQLERTQVLMDAVQSRINALNTDFVNTDDPARREVVDQNRRRALAELDRLKTETELFTKNIADIEEEARRAGAPPGWLR